MATVTPVLDDREAERRDEFVGRLFQAALGTLDVATIYIGNKLGFYKALRERPLSAEELAQTTGADARYVREWLEQQAASGVLELDANEAARFSLPPAHAEVLIDADSLNYLGGYMRLMVGIIKPIDLVVDGFRTGAGMAYEALDDDVHEAIAESNRPMHVNLLGREWIPAIPDVHKRLQSKPPARVADVGCGYGWSSISLARAYPVARVDGFDTESGSSEQARLNAAQAGVADRVTFHAADASQADGPYDLVLAIECIHDMSQPVAALRVMRQMAGDAGTVVVVDERVGEQFSAPADDLERLYYGFSVLHCLPVGRSSTPSAATGTVMRPSLLRAYAREAGFSDIEVLPIENDFWRFYRMVG
jgi:precorrin-6B methylase 2